MSLLVTRTVDRLTQASTEHGDPPDGEHSNNAADVILIYDDDDYPLTAIERTNFWCFTCNVPPGQLAKIIRPTHEVEGDPESPIVRPRQFRFNIKTIGDKKQAYAEAITRGFDREDTVAPEDFVSIPWGHLQVAFYDKLTGKTGDIEDVI